MSCIPSKNFSILEFWFHGTPHGTPHSLDICENSDTGELAKSVQVSRPRNVFPENVKTVSTLNIMCLTMLSFVNSVIQIGDVPHATRLLQLSEEAYAVRDVHTLLTLCLIHIQYATEELILDGLVGKERDDTERAVRNIQHQTQLYAQSGIILPATCCVSLFREVYYSSFIC
jgi:hypothetical protein